MPVDTTWIHSTGFLVYRMVVTRIIHYCLARYCIYILTSKRLYIENTSIESLTVSFLVLVCIHMTIRVSVQYDGGSLPDIIVLTLTDYL